MQRSLCNDIRIMHIVRETSCTNTSYKPTSFDSVSIRAEKRDHIFVSAPSRCVLFVLSCLLTACLSSFGLMPAAHCLFVWRLHHGRHFIQLHIRPRHLSSHTHLRHPSQQQPLGWQWRWCRLPRSIFVRRKDGRKERKKTQSVSQSVSLSLLWTFNGFNYFHTSSSGELMVVARRLFNSCSTYATKSSSLIAWNCRLA